MARIRSLHPTLFTDEAYASLPMAARVLLTGIWTECDDHGVFEWKPLGLKMKVFPADPLTEQEIIGLLAALSTNDCIKRFEIDGKPYGAVRNFCKWQRPKKPTYWHPFKGAGVEALTPWCRTYLAFGTSPVEDQSPTAPEKSPQMEDGGWRMEGERESHTDIKKPVVVVVPDEKAPSTTTTTVSKAASQGKASLGAFLGRPLPADWVPDDTTCDKVAAMFGMTLVDVNAELPAFHALNVQNGTISQDWGSTFFLFAKQWKVRQARNAPRVEMSKAPTRTKPFEPAEADWERACEFYAKTGRWSAQLGPDPLSGKCRCPIAILTKHGINPETGERSIPPKKVAAS